MLEKLLEGEPDLEAIANLAQRRARMKIPEILQSLEGHRLREHHRRMLRLSLEHLAFLERQIDAIDAEVFQLIEREGYQASFDLLQSIPGVRGISAAALLAETGADMSVFPSEAQLSSWIGVCPGNRISAGKNRSSAISRGNRWARTTLVECAWAAISKKDCHLKERFRILCKKGRKTRFDCCRAFFSSDPAPHPGKRNRLPRGRSTGGRAQEGTSDSSLCAPAGQTRCRGAFGAA